MVTSGKMNMRVDNKEVRYIDINKVKHYLVKVFDSS